MRPPKAEPRHARWAWAVPVAALTLALLVMVLDPVALRLVRNAAFDQYQRWSPRPYVDAPVRIVDIDDESLRRFGQWPWPRTRVAQLVDEIEKLHPSAAALDVMFPEPDGSSPVAVLKGPGVPESTARYIASLPDNDAVLAQSLARGPMVISFALTDVRSAPSQPPPQLKSGYITLGADPIDSVVPFSSSVVSLQVLQQAAAGQGAMTFVPDADGILRQVPLLMSLEGRLVPSLAAEALRVSEHAGNFVVRSARNGGGVIEVGIGGRHIATDASGAMWVHYSERQARRYVPAWKILEHQVEPEQIKGRIVLVGTSAPGLMDLRFNPRGEIIPGVEVHAQALEQVLSNQPLTRPGWAPAVELIATALAGLAVGVVAMECGVAASTLGFLGLAGALCGCAWFAFAHSRLLIDPATPALALATVFMPTTVVRHLLSERRQRWVKNAFARYVSPNLVDYLIAHPGALELGGKRQRCSFVFADLQGFTGWMETMDPPTAVAVLNAYLDRMIAIAFENEGTLDRIVGDAVAIVFSAPIEQPDHERRALRCALQMQAFALQHLEALARSGVAFCATRIGVHTGEVTVGNFGGSTIFDYRALGDPVNTASRLEGANKYLGTRICVSAATLAGCDGAPVRPIGRLTLAGRVEPVMAYEPIAGGTEALASDPEYLHAFELMCALRPEALAAFEALAAARPDDPLARLHAGRLRAGERGDAIDLQRK